MPSETEKMLIARQAAEWRLRLETADPAERAAFWKWLAESPAHVRETLAAEVTHLVLAGLLHDRQIDASEFLQQSAHVQTIEQPDPGDLTPEYSISAIQPAKNRTAGDRTRWVFVAAASFAIAIAGSVVGYTLLDHRIDTGPGEWRTKVLSDGTTVLAAPNTKARVEFTQQQRIVRLARGEALFHVTKNAQRPFIVVTELANVRALGTEFAVRRDAADRLRVTVKEGVVSVARNVGIESGAEGTVTLRAGDGVNIEDAGALTRERINVENEFAWESGQLIFDQDTVATAVNEFNRFNKRQIRVLDPAITGHVVRGVFSATDPESFAAYVAKQEALTLVSEDSGTLVLAPPANAPDRHSQGPGER